MRIPAVFFVFVLLVLYAALAPPVYAMDNTTNTTRLAFNEDWLKGVVVVVYGNQYGTGFWINPTHIATAAHVVGFNPQARATIIRGNVQAQGRVVALDRQADVAILYVADSDRFEKHVFPIARAMPPLTSTIYVIGYPMELYQILGSLEALSEHPRVLRTTFAWSASGLVELGGIVDAGNSGGPVLDYYGNVIGIVSFAIRGEAGYMYYATSAGNLKQLCLQHGIAYLEGTNGLLPAGMTEDPVLAGAIAGASASLLTDILILGLGATLGAIYVSRGRKRWSSKRA